MSGGTFNYEQTHIGYELFGHDLTLDYGKEGFDKSIKASKVNPMEHRIISEIVWDVLCLIHSLDYYRSGDILEKDYLEDIKYFTDKWFKLNEDKLLEKYSKYLDNECDELKKELYEFGAYDKNATISETPITNNENITPNNKKIKEIMNFNIVENSPQNIPECCKHCNNHPSNGGTGICHCALPYMNLCE